MRAAGAEGAASLHADRALRALDTQRLLRPDERRLHLPALATFAAFGAFAAHSAGHPTVARAAAVTCAAAVAAVAAVAATVPGAPIPTGRRLGSATAGLLAALSSKARACPTAGAAATRLAPTVTATTRQRRAYTKPHAPDPSPFFHSSILLMRAHPRPV